MEEGSTRSSERAARAGFLLRFFFPPACLGCGDGEARFFSGGVCDDCWTSVPEPSPIRCRVCDLPINAPGAAELREPVCGRCLASPPPYDRIVSAAPYQAAAESILKAFKFRQADYLAPHLARRMARICRFDPAPQLIVPVPATRKERRARGFFPAGELATALASRLRIPVSTRILLKTRETRRQVGLSHRDRQENVRGAFLARESPATVLVVDDVATSGATLSACARALRKSGAKVVYGVSFARALPEPF